MKNVRLVRKDESAVSPVIATILMVAITVVLAAVLYVMVSGLLTGPGAQRPEVTFSSPTVITNGYSFSVAGASQQVAPASYKVNYQVNSTTGTAVLLQQSMTVVIPAPVSATFTIAWISPGGGGTLSGGDRFQITRTGGVPISSSFTFYLLWVDGTVIQTQAYTT
jgi:flagellin-like protein